MCESENCNFPTGNCKFMAENIIDRPTQNCNFASDFLQNGDFQPRMLYFLKKKLFDKNQMFHQTKI